MDNEQVKQLLLAQLADCEIFVEGDGSHFQLVVIGDVFSGLMPIKRQQLVYKALNDVIASGDVHAVTMKTYTPDEWANQS